MQHLGFKISKNDKTFDLYFIELSYITPNVSNNVKKDKWFLFKVLRFRSVFCPSG